MTYVQVAERAGYSPSATHAFFKKAPVYANLATFIDIAGAVDLRVVVTKNETLWQSRWKTRGGDYESRWKTRDGDRESRRKPGRSR